MIELKKPEAKAEESKKKVLHKLVKKEAKNVSKPKGPKGEGKEEGIKNPAGASGGLAQNVVPTHESHTTHFQHVDGAGMHVQIHHEEHIPYDHEAASGKESMPHEKYKNIMKHKNE